MKITIYSTERPWYNDNTKTAVAYWLLMPDGTRENVGEVLKKHHNEHIYDIIRFTAQKIYKAFKQDISRQSLDVDMLQQHEGKQKKEESWPDSKNNVCGS